MKKLFLVFQKKDKSITEYTHNFKALLDIADQTGVMPGWYKAMAKISYMVEGNGIARWEALKASNGNAKDVEERGMHGKLGEWLGRESLNQAMEEGRLDWRFDRCLHHCRCHQNVGVLERRVEAEQEANTKD